MTAMVHVRKMGVAMLQREAVASSGMVRLCPQAGGQQHLAAAVLLIRFPDNAARILCCKYTALYFLGHHTTGTDNRSIPDTAHAANPNIVTNLNWPPQFESRSALY